MISHLEGVPMQFSIGAVIHDVQLLCTCLKHAKTFEASLFRKFFVVWARTFKNSLVLPFYFTRTFGLSFYSMDYNNPNHLMDLITLLDKMALFGITIQHITSLDHGIHYKSIKGLPLVAVSERILEYLLLLIRLDFETTWHALE